MIDIREVWRDEESGRTKLQVVAVPVKAKSALPPLRARHTSEVLSSNVLGAILTLAGMPSREQAEQMESNGLARFSASMKSSADVSASI